MRIKLPDVKVASAFLFSCCYLAGVSQGHGRAHRLPDNQINITQNPAANQEAAIRQLEKILLGNIYISQIAPADLPAAYETFIQNIKGKSKTWTATDWQNAEHIMNKLHFRRKTVQAQIPAADMRKITGSQGQYRALKEGNQF